MNLSAATLNLSNTARAYIKSGEYSTDTPSLTLGEANGINEGVLEIISNSGVSNLLEGNPTTGNLEVWKNAGGTASLVATFSQSTSYFNSNMNLESGKTYQINGVALNTDTIPMSARQQISTIHPLYSIQI